MRKFTRWTFENDRHFLTSCVVVVALIAGATWFVVARGAVTVEAVTYAHPSSVSETKIDVADRAAQVLGDDVVVRFVEGLHCGAVVAIGCARSDRPGVNYVDAGYAAAPETLWFEVQAVAFHEAAHAAVRLHGLDVSPFAEIDPDVPPGEAFADCVSAALEEARTSYVQCPIKWQERALEVLGIDRLARIWIEDTDEPTLGLWR